MSDNALTNMRKCFTKVQEAYYSFQKSDSKLEALEYCLSAQEDLQNAIVYLNKVVGNEQK